MRFHTFVTLCACALYVRAASIPSPEKKIEDLDNVDLENVESDLVDQPTVQELDNNLRKASDIPVKVVEEPAVLDETSNDYVPNKDESISIKRLEIDLNNPGPPQRQEHETQNPENYGEKERAVFAIVQKTKEAQSIFNNGFKEVTDSLYNINKGSEELPVAVQKLKNLNESFSVEIEKLNDTIRSYFESKPAKLDGKLNKENKLKFVASNMQNLESNFKFVVNTLNEGIELLSIIREEDETIKSETKALIKEENESVKQSTSDSTTQPAASGPTNGMTSFLAQLQGAVNDRLTSIFSAWQNQGQQPTKPDGAQSDEPAPTASPAPWSPQVLYQQFQNFINQGQGTQQNQQVQAPAQGTGIWPLSQVFNNIVQLIQRPGQAASQKPANSSSKPDTQKPTDSSSKPDTHKPDTPSKQPEKESSVSHDAISPPVSASADSPAPEKAEVSQPSQPASIPQAAPEQPAQGGPIQQLVQNNPIIKGIQSAVQRLQGTPNSETPRNEIIENDKKETEELENKGHYGGSNTNQGDTNDSSRVDEKIEEQKEAAPAAQEAAVEEIKSEETKPLTSSDKTE